MMDPSMLAGIAPDLAKNNQPQSLPQAQQSDVERFGDVISGKLDIGQITSAQKTEPVLKIAEPGKVEASSFKDLLVQHMSALDSSYSDVVGNLVNKPSLQDYFDSSSIGSREDHIRTYPDNLNEVNADNMQEHFDGLLQDIESKQTAAIEYQRDMTGWTMNAEMWMTTINLLSSAVNQVAQGFKTLFRASG